MSANAQRYIGLLFLVIGCSGFHLESKANGRPGLVRAAGTAPGDRSRPGRKVSPPNLTHLKGCGALAQLGTANRPLEVAIPRQGITIPGQEKPMILANHGRSESVRRVPGLGRFDDQFAAEGEIGTLATLQILSRGLR